MGTRSMKRRLLKARILLSQTVQKILDINKTRKKFSIHKNTHTTKEDFKEELKVLNRIAEHQAQLIRLYETRLALVDSH